MKDLMLILAISCSNVLFPMQRKTFIFLIFPKLPARQTTFRLLVRCRSAPCFGDEALLFFGRCSAAAHWCDAAGAFASVCHNQGIVAGTGQSQPQALPGQAVAPAGSACQAPGEFWQALHPCHSPHTTK